MKTEYNKAILERTSEMKCLSCDKVIKVRNLKRHSKAKLHLKSVEKKVNVMKQNITTKN